MIRKMRKTDIDRVADIWLDTNQKAHDFIPASYWQDNFEEVKQMLLQAEVYVWEEKARIFGFAGSYGDYIAGIFVCGEAQSGGIGKELMAFLKERKETLKLNVYKKNIRAVRFYQREDFAILSEGRDEATGEEEYCMGWSKSKTA